MPGFLLIFIRIRKVYAGGYKFFYKKCTSMMNVLEMQENALVFHYTRRPAKDENAMEGKRNAGNKAT